MNSFCELCSIFIKSKSKIKPCKSKVRKEVDKYRHIKVTIENLDIKNIDELFCA